MFYSDAILSKKGALAKVWLAAHMESRLTKGQVGSVDVEQSVKDIMQEQAEPMALRLSGQLLLGVCRIYSRKAKYLLDDCNDALVTIRMQIRPALVDLPDDQLAARSHDLDLDDAGDLGMEIDWDMPLPAFDDFDDDSYGAPQRQVTLSSTHARRLGLGGNVRDFDVGPSDGFASQDFDLGLDVGLGGEDDDDDTVELGRHDGANLSGARLSLGGKSLLNDSLPNAGDLSRPSLGGALDMDVDFDDHQPIDLGLDIGSPRLDDDFGGMGGQPDADDYAGGMDFDMGGGGGGDFDLPPAVPDLVLDGEGQRSRSRESSRLSTPPADLDESAASIAGNLTPRTAALVSAMANKADRAAAAADGTPTGPKKKKSVRVIFDETTELDAQTMSSSQASRRKKDLSAILQPQRFIPGNASLIRFDEIRQDPLAFYLPTRTRSDGELVLYAGPPELSPDLAQIFEFPVTGILRRRRDGDGDDDAARKRQRLEAGDNEEGDDEDVELGRRDERAKSIVGDGTFDLGAGQPDDHFDFGGMGGQPDDEDRPFNPDDPSFDDFGGGMDYQPDAADGGNFLDDQLVLDDGRSDRARSVISERSGQSGASNGPRGARRARAGSSRGGSAARSLGADDEEETESQRVREKQRALGVLQQELGRPTAVEGEFEFIDDAASEKVMDFKTVNAKSSRKAAAGFFFELLVLGTKDAIKLSQSTAYGDIEVRAKERLFDTAIIA